MLPFYITKTLLFYNKPMFQKAGLSGPPQSFDAILDCGAEDDVGRRLGLSDAQLRLALLAAVTP